MNQPELPIESNMEIKKTTNYEMFQKHENQVSISERNVAKIIESIQSKNLLHLKPIIIDANMAVIDGQHRLEAAKRLGIPIYYISDITLTPTDLAKTNEAQRVWGTQEFLHHYASLGYENYITLIRLSKETQTTTTCILTLLGYRGKAITKTISSGKFKITQKDEKDVLCFLQNFNNHIKPVLSIQKGLGTWAKAPTSFRALFIMSRCEQFEWQQMTRGFENYAGRLSGRTTCREYIQMYCECYNYRRGAQNRIESSTIEAESWFPKIQTPET